ncbi:MAG: anti-sigma factor [Actinomycetota bacterium]|nr:anti-sigma factor [Actinomycetota bacterium]
MSAEHEELENSVAAYVLGATDPEDQERLAAHLEACASCREIAARLAPGVSSLALEPEPIKPPGRLEERVVAAAAAARSTTTAQQQPTRLFVLPGPPRVRFRFPGVRAGLAAAAVILFAAGATVGLGVDRWGQLRPSAPPSGVEVQRYQLAGNGPMAGVQAKAVYLRRESLTLVDFKYLPQPGPDRIYQLWLITDHGKPLPAGVFAPESDGSKVVLVDRNLNGIKALAVTAEPAPNGSPSPSQTPQLTGSIA